MDGDELIAKMKARVARCRMLADSTTDLHAARILRDMADEGETDIVRLLSEGDGGSRRARPR
jgi:hypothetical protein